MTATERALPVAAGVLVDASGRVLLAQRSAQGNEPGKWEFAGGKIAVGERAETALRRELLEELGIEIGAAEALTVVRWRGSPRPINLHTYRIRDWRGALSAREHQQLRWVAPAELIGYPLPAPDRPIRARLALPAGYLITPEPGPSTAEFIDALTRAIENPALGMLSLRAKSLAPAARALLAERVVQRARTLRPELIVLIHGETELAASLGFDGVQLSSRQLLEAPRRPLSESSWVLASCHSSIELRAAEALAVDAVTLSPVLATATHAQARPLGWRTFRAQARNCNLPVYALGGLSGADLATAQAAAAHGIAGIRGFWPG